MDFSFFTTDNKSGYKTRESWLSKNHPKEYNNIIQYCEPYNLKSFKEKIWFYYHKLTEHPKCCGCGVDVAFSGRFDRGYKSFCTLECANNNGGLIEKIKKTNQERYGIDFYTQHEDFIEKQKQTKMERYGDENYNNVKKIMETKMERYGDENYNNVDGAKLTSIKKYGVTNPSKSIEVINKIKRTNQKKYGHNSPTQSIRIKEKVYKTLLRKMKSKIKNLYFIDYDFKTSEYCLKCPTCNVTFKIPMALYNERNRLGYGVCTNCNPIGIKNTSKHEKDLVSSLKEFYEDDVVTNDKTLLDGKEVDILLPNKNVAIEFNGLYWHSELYKDKNYHLNKTNLAKEKGVDLIHVFEDEWLFNKKIVLSIIKNRLNFISDTIFGRRCEIREITPKQSKKFLNENHIQGNVNSNIKLGLFYNGELVSVMTFGKGRIALGGDANEWELVRFCNKLNTTVVGGASKLFKYFVNKHNPKNIISYSDSRWFDGGLYSILGFSQIHHTTPNYWYFLENRREHRFKYRKDVLVKQGFDSNKTEREIMLERGYNRIYDCGNIRWEWNNIK